MDDNNSPASQKTIFRFQLAAEIKRHVSRTAEDGVTRVILLYGPGGSGKTVFVRQISKLDIQNAICIEPIDVDDTEYWIGRNRKRHIAEQISNLTNTDSFQPYFEYVAANTDKSDRDGDELYFNCLNNLLDISGKIPIIVLDTVEAIRNTDVRQKLTDSIKRYRNTVCILAGRPPDNLVDKIEEEFRTSEYGAPPKIEKLNIAGFSEVEAELYLRESSIGESLTDEQIQRIVLLTGGRPLWLALTVEFLKYNDLPIEAKDGNSSTVSIQQLKAHLPYPNPIQHSATATSVRLQDPVGIGLQQEFERELLTIYKEQPEIEQNSFDTSDFLREAIQRLAIVRKRMNREIWQHLMSDVPLPKDTISLDIAWDKLQEIPWIRPRANKHYITLHDALAEALAGTIIPFRDKTEQWQQHQWQMAKDAYFVQINHGIQFGHSVTTKGELLDTYSLELLKTAHFYYSLLSNFGEGCQEFIQLTKAPETSLRLRELLSAEMNAFLSSDREEVLRDIIYPIVTRFQNWIKNVDRRDIYYEIMLCIAAQQRDSEQTQQALDTLRSILQIVGNDPQRQFEIYIQLGNSLVRQRGGMRKAGEEYEQARKVADDLPSSSSKDKARMLKELALYWRQKGNWETSANLYRAALKSVPMNDEAERASIQTNYAFVLSLLHSAERAKILVTQALDTRKKIGHPFPIALSISTKGEVLRYQTKFEDAWNAYSEAEDIFQQIARTDWIGVIRQQQAICLFEASTSEPTILLGHYKDSAEMLSAARVSIEEAIEICRNLNFRYLASGLNRAGRIFGKGLKQYDKALTYFEEAIKQAKVSLDGQFWLSGIVEYCELCQIASVESADPTVQKHYQKLVSDKDADYQEFLQTDLEPLKHLQGRWELVKAWNKLRDAQFNSSDKSLYEIAKSLFRVALPKIALSYQSHGVPTLVSEFEKLKIDFKDLPSNIRDNWLSDWHESWSGKDYDNVSDQDAILLLLALHSDLFSFSKSL